MTNDDWQMVVAAVVQGVTEEPERFGDVVKAMQQGVMNALGNERRQTSALAYGLQLQVKSDRKKLERLHEQQPQAIDGLLAVFGGSGYGKELEKIKQELEADNDER